MSTSVTAERLNHSMMPHTHPVIDSALITQTDIACLPLPLSIPLFLSLPLSLSHALSPSLSLSLHLSPSISLSLSPSLSLYLSLSINLLNITLCFVLFPCFFLSLSGIGSPTSTSLYSCLTHSISLSLSHSLTHYLSLPP